MQIPRIQYKLLNNATAVLITRQPVVLEKELDIVFLDAPENATVLMSASGASFCRKLTDGICTVPIDKMIGTVKITLTVLNNAVPLKKWGCEELKTQHLRDGSVLVFPNDLNLPQTIVDLRIENDEIRREHEKLKEEFKKIKERIEKVFEAYKFV